MYMLHHASIKSGIVPRLKIMYIYYITHVLSVSCCLNCVPEAEWCSGK